MKRLPPSTLSNPKAIEELFCKEFEKAELFPLDEESNSVLLSLIVNKSKPKRTLSDHEKPYVMRIIEKRFKFLFPTVVVEDEIIFMITTIALSPGNAIMYITYIQYWLKKNNERNLTLELFCKRIFPDGFPSHEFLHKLWYSLKVEAETGHTGNLLDSGSAGVSIQFEK